MPTKAFVIKPDQLRMSLAREPTQAPSTMRPPPGLHTRAGQYSPLDLMEGASQTLEDTKLGAEPIPMACPSQQTGQSTLAKVRNLFLGCKKEHGRLHEDAATVESARSQPLQEQGGHFASDPSISCNKSNSMSGPVPTFGDALMEQRHTSVFGAFEPSQSSADAWKAAEERVPPRQPLLDSMAVSEPVGIPRSNKQKAQYLNVEPKRLRPCDDDCDCCSVIVDEDDEETVSAWVEERGEDEPILGSWASAAKLSLLYNSELPKAQWKAYDLRVRENMMQARQKTHWIERRARVIEEVHKERKDVRDTMRWLKQRREELWDETESRDKPCGWMHEQCWTPEEMLKRMLNDAAVKVKEKRRN